MSGQLDIALGLFNGATVLTRNYPMYRIETVSDGNRWMVIDAQDRVVFVGTMQQAEDWLDCDENVNRGPGKLGAWAHRTIEAWGRPVDRLAGACLRLFGAGHLRH